MVAQPSAVAQAGRRKAWHVGRMCQWPGKRKGTTMEYASPKGKRLLANALGPIGLVGPSGEATACEARWADTGENSNGNLIPNFKWIWNLARLWEILQLDFEGIWTRAFFLNSSRILKDF
jgi:hypothetical protein